MRVDSPLVDDVQTLDTGQDAKRAVERTSLRHRVDVRSGHHRGPRAAEAPERITGLIDARCESGLLHAGEQPLPGLFVRGAPAGPRNALACGVSAEPGARFDVRFQTRNRDGGRHGACSIAQTLTLSRSGSYDAQ